MNALVLDELGRGFDLEEIDIAPPVEREVLVSVQAAGLCHTDLLFATHDLAPTPSVFGHEVAGIVIAVGPEVAQIHVGDHVVGSGMQACGDCARWVSGRSCQRPHTGMTLRSPTEAPRLSRDGPGLFRGLALGGFAERALAHENQLAVVRQASCRFPKLRFSIGTILRSKAPGSPRSIQGDRRAFLGLKRAASCARLRLMSTSHCQHVTAKRTIAGTSAFALGPAPR